MLSTNRRTRLVLPTENDPSMQIFFCSIRWDRSGRRRRESDVEGDAAVEVPRLFVVFISQRLRGAHTTGNEQFSWNPIAHQQRGNRGSALTAQYLIGAFNPRGIRVADDR